MDDYDSEVDKEIIKKIIEKSKMSSRELCNIVNISKSHICRIRNGFINKTRENNNCERLTYILCDIFKKVKGRYGRRKMSKELEKYGFFPFRKVSWKNNE